MWQFWKSKHEKQIEEDIEECGKAIDAATEQAEEKAKDISEPVLMIVKALQERPKSFYIRSKDFGPGFYSYEAVDRKTKAVFRLTRDTFGEFVDAPFALSEAENKLLIFEGRKWLYMKKARVQERKRKRWFKIYSELENTNGQTK